jgi:glycosyltransferase involved in cell wall biosynthesis
VTGAVRRRIAVIIPYYQRDPGILARALDSVRAQELPRGLHLHVYVVDDGSPLPAAGEIADSSALTLLVQDNAGPGAARNAALDRVEADGGAEVVAFLDSDDIWHPTHLAEAVAALDRGYDFYCCDNARPGSFALFSEANAALRGGGAALRPRATVLDEEGPVLGFAAANAHRRDRHRLHQPHLDRGGRGRSRAVPAVRRGAARRGRGPHVLARTCAGGRADRDLLALQRDLRHGGEPVLLGP